MLKINFMKSTREPEKNGLWETLESFEGILALRCLNKYLLLPPLHVNYCSGENMKAVAPSSLLHDPTHVYGSISAISFNS